MQKSGSEQVAVKAHRKVKTSTTLNRRYVKRPEIERPSAKELKDRAIAKALANAAKPEEKTKKKGNKIHFGFWRIALALACTAAAVFTIVYFVNLNMPDISMKVAAMQNGIDASYPSYVPRDFNLSDILSEDGKITLSFSNSSTDEAFVLTEENSSWDSNTLLANYVKKRFGNDYSTIREQGLTIYVNGSNAAWVNGGVLYKIEAGLGVLSKKQIRSIAVSL